MIGCITKITLNWMTGRMNKTIKIYNKSDVTETWKDIVGYDGDYQVSDLGRIKSWKGRFPIILKPKDNGIGYFQVELRKNNKRKMFYVQQLVARHFIDNPEDKPVVNHRNKDRSDNRVNSLEWMTYAENVKHRDAIIFTYENPNEDLENPFGYNNNFIDGVRINAY